MKSGGKSKEKLNEMENKDKITMSFPKKRPTCCGREMYASGGTLGKRPDGKVGDVEHFWRCDVCKSEVIDILS